MQQWPSWFNFDVIRVGHMAEPIFVSPWSGPSERDHIKAKLTLDPLGGKHSGYGSSMEGLTPATIV